MTDTMMIRDCIRSQGMKLGHVAHVLGITNNTLRCKLENESEFKVSEAEKLSKMLGMTVEQRDRCFFGPAGQHPAAALHGKAEAGRGDGQAEHQLQHLSESPRRPAEHHRGLCRPLR